MLEVSEATKRNWKRLGSDGQGKLKARANKSLSEKVFIPSECLVNRESAEIIGKIRQIVRQYGLAAGEAADCLCLKLLREYGLEEKTFVKKFIKGLNAGNVNLFDEIRLPQNEPDILGAIYQSLLFEGNKSRTGSYYTPLPVIKDLEEGVSLDGEMTALDPCCGSGMFLTQLETDNPKNLWGFDFDPIAVRIAKANLLIRFKEYDFEPNIYCMDFLKSTTDRKFDYIISNPPWGARVESPSSDSFSCFLEKAFDLVGEGGEIRFLLPQSALSTKAHRDIREKMLKGGDLYSVKLYGNCFKNVMSKAVGVLWKKSAPKAHFSISGGKNIYILQKEEILKSPGFIISPLSTTDAAILEKVYSKKHLTLEGSEWALGIVTGDNGRHLLGAPAEDAEPVYTGREIGSYILKPARFFIRYDRKKYQQVAPEHLYRAPEKLVYKFISDKLVFAYDDEGSLFLNSANILIPKIQGYGIKSALALLNSKLFSFIHFKKSGQIKILKGNLLQLPFPPITPRQNDHLTRLADEVLRTKTQNPEIDDFVYNLFGITEEEREYIEKNIK